MHENRLLVNETKTEFLLIGTRQQLTKVNVDHVKVATHGEAELQSLMNRFSHACKQFGLNISLKKTNVMDQDTNDRLSISIDGHHLEVVESFTYLGSTMSNTLSLDAELNSHIAKASATLAKLKKRVWTNSRLTEKTKLKVYKACVLGTLL
ncbi:uncharacterized protein [Montipora capricornis]|uniref:uncharacterized protein n=1 Tax=Montipora capricornis TaxID=246305 RepID=UPI0035F19F28